MVEVGCDIVEVSRFNGKGRDDAFVKRFFSKNEIDYCFGQRDPGQCLAARFAAKEAYIKAGNPKAEFSDIEVAKSEVGKPKLKLKGKLVPGALSISHVKDYAMAVVVIEEEQSLV